MVASPQAGKDPTEVCQCHAVKHSPHLQSGPQQRCDNVTPDWLTPGLGSSCSPVSCTSSQGVDTDSQGLAPRMHNCIDNPHFLIFKNQQRIAHYQWNCDISASRGRTMTILGTKSIRKPPHIWWAGDTRVQNGFRSSCPHFQVLKTKKNTRLFRDYPLDFSKDYCIFYFVTISWKTLNSKLLIPRGSVWSF